MPELGKGPRMEVVIVPKSYKGIEKPGKLKNLSFRKGRRVVIGEKGVFPPGTRLKQPLVVDVEKYTDRKGRRRYLALARTSDGEGSKKKFRRAIKDMGSEIPVRRSLYHSRNLTPEQEVYKAVLDSRYETPMI